MHFVDISWLFLLCSMRDFHNLPFILLGIYLRLPLVPNLILAASNLSPKYQNLSTFSSSIRLRISSSTY